MATPDELRPWLDILEKQPGVRRARLRPAPGRQRNGPEADAWLTLDAAGTTHHYQVELRPTHPLHAAMIKALGSERAQPSLPT